MTSHRCQININNVELRTTRAHIRVIIAIAGVWVPSSALASNETASHTWRCDRCIVGSAPLSMSPAATRDDRVCCADSDVASRACQPPCLVGLSARYRAPGSLPGFIPGPVGSVVCIMLMGCVRSDPPVSRTTTSYLVSRTRPQHRTNWFRPYTSHTPTCALDRNMSMTFHNHRAITSWAVKFRARLKINKELNVNRAWVENKDRG